MSNFNELKIKFCLSIGYSNANQEDTEMLSDYWTEGEWNILTEKEKGEWLNQMYNDWKAEYEDGGAWIE